MRCDLNNRRFQLLKLMKQDQETPVRTELSGGGRNWFGGIMSKFLRPKEIVCPVVRTGPRYHFYEWSNPYARPVEFYDLESLKVYLNKYDIPFLAWQEELLLVMPDVHLMCRNGGKDLVIRNTLERLREVSLTYKTV